MTTHAGPRRKFFGRAVLAEVTPHLLITDTSDYDSERGDVYEITSSSNGEHWSTGHAFSRETAVKLRDALNALLLADEEA